jgi:hypothetical protein
MAYAPGAGAPKTGSRAPLNRQATNGRPAARLKVTPASPERRPTTSFLAGLGIGLAVGAAVALLLAPKSGAEMRQSIRNRGRKAGNRARDAWEDLRVELEATRRALHRRKRDAKMEIEEERA